MSAGRQELRGRLVLADRVTPGRVVVEDGVLAVVDLEERGTGGGDGLPYLAPGFVDVHVHGWGGHDAMGGVEALDGMARALARRGVTSFLPTAVSAPLDALGRFVATVAAWRTAGGGSAEGGEAGRGPAGDGAEPLGVNLEGPFLARARKGAHDEAALLEPAAVAADALEPLLDGLRLITVAPELPGSVALIGALRARGVAVSLGHSAASLDEASAGYDAGATGTTHLFNAMSGIDHRAPGLTAAALVRDDAFVELIADGHHVHPALWAIIRRAKRPERLVLVSDAIALAGMGDGRSRLGSLEVEVHGGRVTLSGTTTLAGSVIALDDAVRNLVVSGVPLHEAVAAASANPLALIGQTDRGRLAVGQRADLVELDEELAVSRMWIAGRNIDV